MESVMTFDLVAAIELTASAALVVAVASLVMARTPGRRIAIAAGLAAWFGMVVALGASGALSGDGALGVPGMGLVVTLPVLVMAALTFATSGGRLAVGNAPLPAVIALNAVRIDGVLFLLLYAAGRLPAPFAPMAGLGDILTGVTAPLVAWMVAREHPGWRLAALAWNVFGILDLLNAIGLGVTSSPGPLRVFAGDPSSAIMAGLPWLLIPGFLVPLLAFSHVVLFARLARAPRAQGRALVA